MYRADASVSRSESVGLLTDSPADVLRCIFERRLSSLVKDDFCYLELSGLQGKKADRWEELRDLCKATREAPIPPDMFEEQLKEGVAREEAAEGTGIKFTSGKDLTDVVIPQYEAGFLRLMGEASELSYGSLGWGDEEMVQLAASVAYAHTRGALGLCTFISLGSNNIGDIGMQVFSDLIRSGALG